MVLLLGGQVRLYLFRSRRRRADLPSAKS